MDFWIKIDSVNSQSLMRPVLLVSSENGENKMDYKLFWYSAVKIIQRNVLNTLKIFFHIS